MKLIMKPISYIIGGYDRLINKLRAKFVNMVSDEKGYKGFVGKDRVFILTGYVSHSDICKIESLGIYGKFVNKYLFSISTSF